MKKDLPPSTIQALSPPNKDYTYFQDWQAHPFRFEASGFELVNGWWLADAALLAYADEAFINDVFETSGLKREGFAVECFDAENLECFVASNDRLIIASFRGTEINNFWGSVTDWATNFDFFPAPYSAGGQVHSGFLDAATSIWDKVARYITEILGQGRGQKLWITGHSLGAALATLAASKASSESGLDVQGVYTFGSPRVGDEGFKNHLAGAGLESKIYRFVNNNDVVAKVPPAELYTHVGALKYLDNAGHLHELGDESQVFSESEVIRFPRLLLDRLQSLTRLRFGSGFLVPGFLADHAPIYYAIHVWNNYDSAG